MKFNCCNLALFASVLLFSVFSSAEKIAKPTNDLEYKITYLVSFLPKEESAKVEISIKNSDLIRYFDFNLKKHVLTLLESSGKIEHQNGRLKWWPSSKDAYLSYKVKISHQRGKGFDALMTENWTIFRGDDLVPPARTLMQDGAISLAKIKYHLPSGWNSVNMAWPKLGKSSFIIDNPSTKFDRPTGWVIAGKIGTRRETLGKTNIAVSAPVGQGFHRMDVLSMLSLLWPSFEEIFHQMPENLLLVGAGDPFWKGGLSGPQSLFLHADRPMVSENGTSTLVHEIFHVVSGIQGKGNDDWITEGLAEFYAMEILFRAGAVSESRKKKTLQQLKGWSKNVKHLKNAQSKGAYTAKAVLLFYELDEEIKRVTQSRVSLDNIVRILVKKEDTKLKDVREAFVLLTGRKSSVLEKWRKYFVP